MRLVDLRKVLNRESRASKPGRRRRGPEPLRTSRLWLELLEDRTLLSVVTWVGGSGDWDTVANWSDGTTNRLPGPSDDAVIPTAGITVTHGMNVNDQVQSIRSQAALTLSRGTLDLVSGGNVSVSGTFSLAGGTLNNATIASGTTLVGTTSGGTLNGVTLNGNLDLTTAAGVNVSITGGLTLNGTITLGDPGGSTYGALDFPATETLSGTGVIAFGAFSDNRRNAVRLSNANTTLTLGPNIQVHGKNGTVGYSSYWGGSSNVAVVNQGTITADTAGGTISLSALSGNNIGNMNATAGTLAIGLVGTAPSFTNTGNITFATGTTLSLGGGTFNLNSGTLAGSGTMVLNGTVFNGTLTNPGTLVAQGNNTINGTYADSPGSITRVQAVSNTDATITFANGFTNYGTIELTNASSNRNATLAIANSGTLINAVGANINALPGSGGGGRFLRVCSESLKRLVLGDVL